MAQPVFYKYLWFFNALWRYKRITRAEMSSLWQRCEWSGGAPMSRRTFVNYKAKVEEIFDVNIAYDSATYEYYIDDAEVVEGSNVRRWVYDLLSVNHLVADSRELATRVQAEHVPVGLDVLETIIGAMRAGKVLRCVYHPFWKIEETEVELEAYFVKSFRRRWYVVGRDCAEDRVKTYALDRIVEMRIIARGYEVPAGFDAGRYFENSYGVMRGDEVCHDIELRATLRQAQYFRALPLHASQRECEVQAGMVTFRYKMYITYDLIQELLSLGREVVVVSPPQLREEVTRHLQAALENYAEE